MYISDWDIRWPGKWKPKQAVEEILKEVRSNNTEGIRILLIFDTLGVGKPLNLPNFPTELTLAIIRNGQI